MTKPARGCASYKVGNGSGVIAGAANVWRVFRSLLFPSASREMWPTIRSLRVGPIGTAYILRESSDAANSAKARDNRSSWSNSPRLSRPHNSPRRASPRGIFSNWRAWLMLYTAWAAKERARARRCQGRPNKRRPRIDPNQVQHRGQSAALVGGCSSSLGVWAPPTGSRCARTSNRHCRRP